MYYIVTIVIIIIIIITNINCNTRITSKFVSDSVTSSDSLQNLMLLCIHV
jgi:hypothetical protein